MGKRDKKAPTAGDVAALGQGIERASKPASEPASRRGYWTGAHTTHRLLFHLVWIPKYRKRILEGAVASRLRALFVQACEVNDWNLHELNVQPDHVHLLLQIHSRESIAKVVNRLKGGSSRLLRTEFPDLEEFLWGSSFWGDGYFVESVGAMEEGVIRRYLRNQGNPDQSDQGQSDQEIPENRGGE